MPKRLWIPTWLFLVVSLSACSGPQGPAEPPTGSGASPEADAGTEAAPGEADAAPRTPSPEAAGAVRRFWEAATAGDMDALEAAVGFPMSLDAMCRVVGNATELREALGDDTGADHGVAIVEVREVFPGDDLPSAIRRGLAALAARDGNCGEPTDTRIRRAASFERRYFVVDMRVAGDPVARATRASRIGGRWVVTGIDN